MHIIHCVLLIICLPFSCFFGKIENYWIVHLCYTPKYSLDVELWELICIKKHLNISWYVSLLLIQSTCDIIRAVCLPGVVCTLLDQFGPRSNWTALYALTIACLFVSIHGCFGKLLWIICIKINRRQITMTVWGAQ